MPIDPNARRNQKMSAVRLDGEMTKRLEAYIARQVVPPSRTRVIEVALKQFLDADEKKTAADKAA
jgi:predicted transcriptional regulator